MGCFFAALNDIQKINIQIIKNNKLGRSKHRDFNLYKEKIGGNREKPLSKLQSSLKIREEQKIDPEAVLFNNWCLSTTGGAFWYGRLHLAMYY